MLKNQNSYGIRKLRSAVATIDLQLKNLRKAGKPAPLEIIRGFLELIQELNSLETAPAAAELEILRGKLDVVEKRLSALETGKTWNAAMKRGL